MWLTEDKQLDIFIGSKIGSLKHIKYHSDSSKNSKKCIENLIEIKSLEKDEHITCMQWGNNEQNEILIGQKNQQIKLYDTMGELKKSYLADFGAGNVVGLGRRKRKLIAAVASGVVKVWSRKEEVLFDTGGKLDQMQVCPDDPNLFATGGEENDLKVWNVEQQTPIFEAKNLPHDWLQLRKPVWVSGLTFLPGETNVVAVCSPHGYVRLYDARAQRRPVSNIEFPSMAAKCITPSFNDRQVLVGFARGQLHLVDLRNEKPSKGYKGAVGAITSIATATCPDRIVISGSADRHLRIHDLHSKSMLYKQYVTSKVSCVLAQTVGSTPLLRAPEGVKEEEEVREEDDMDQLFAHMQAVGDDSKIKAKSEEPQSKRMKPSAEGSTVEIEADSEADAIKKLLRSTEKQKKRLEMKKKKKKAKSVFHNA